MEEPSGALATSIFLIEGADQPGQVEKLKKALEAMPGVMGVEMNYIVGSAKVRYDPRRLSLDRIKAAMK